MINRFLKLLILVGITGWSLQCAHEDGPVAASAGEAKAGARSSQNATATTSDALKGMVRIPAGAFTFGTTEEEFQFFLKGSLVNFPGMEEALRRNFVIPPKRIELPEFYIDEFEVTNRQYGEFVAATDYMPADMMNYLKVWETAKRYPDWAETLPVVWISVEDAAAYCAWRGGRLPTEQEWEKAARGADGRLFPWGSDLPSGDATNVGTNKVEPAGNRPGDKSPYGVYDLGGNVAELTSSTVESPNGVRVVIKGGAFKGGSRDTMTVKRVLVPEKSVRSESIGCRCVKDASGRK